MYCVQRPLAYQKRVRRRYGGKGYNLSSIYPLRTSFWYAEGILLSPVHQISGTPAVNITGVPLISCASGTRATIGLFLVLLLPREKKKSKRSMSIVNL
jgi:hypothetical protein